MPQGTRDGIPSTPNDDAESPEMKVRASLTHCSRAGARFLRTTVGRATIHICQLDQVAIGAG
jgi:hypothetical protein